MMEYGVATVSSIDKIRGLVCRIASLLWGSFAKETYNLIDPTNQSHPILGQVPKSLGSSVVVFVYMYM